MYEPKKNPDELYHYGVKGMKWANHRYATYDDEGVKNRLNAYGKSHAKYKAAQQELTRARYSGDKAVVAKAKDNLKRSELEAKDNLGQLKKAGRVVEGKKLAAQGKQIKSVKGNVIAQAVITGIGFTPLRLLPGSSAVLAGATAVNAISTAKKISRNRNLGAYYNSSKSGT